MFDRVSWLTNVVPVLLLLGCGPKGSVDFARSEQIRLESAIDRFQSGQLVSELEKHGKLSRLREQGKSPEVSDLGSPRFLKDSGSAAELAKADPCPLVERPTVHASAAEMSAALKSWNACLRPLFHVSETLSDMVSYYKFYRLEPGESQLSSRSPQEMAEYMNRHLGRDGHFPSESPLLRNQFDDDELAELSRLVALRKEALLKFQGQLFASMDARPDLMDHISVKYDRYLLLRALKATADDSVGDMTRYLVTEVIPESQAGMDLRSFPFTSLRPFALLTIFPDEGHDEVDLNLAWENPFKLVRTVLSELGEAPAIVEKMKESYAQLRDQDNPVLPVHAPAAPGAVNVAFLDSGVDFIKYPELGLFLGNGSGETASWDYADEDSNPWLPAISLGEFEHGSATMATLLSVLAHHAPEVLKERRISLAMWKLDALRTVLAGSYAASSPWVNRHGLLNALKREVNAATPRPKIVSVSLQFAAQPLLDALRDPELVQRSPWLWVMAAGNSGLDIKDDKLPSCFHDLKAATRPGARILCVGALEKGIIEDKVAAYSNFGNEVDVYAYESYSGLCPSGTSCATPAITATAALLAARFPSLSVEQLKASIVEAAEVKTLKQGSLSRIVRVFDPATMLPQALECARKRSVLVP